MMKPRYVWPLFAACLAVVAGTLGWVSHRVLELDRAQAQLARQANIEERVRLALWRLDSAATAVIAAENARPYFTYRSFYPADRAYGANVSQMQNNAFGGLDMLPSPLLAQTPPHVRLHFQVGADGTVSSPQVPTGRSLQLAKAEHLSEELLAQRSLQLSQLKLDANRSVLASAAAQASQPPATLVYGPMPVSEQTAMNQSEYNARVNNTNFVNGSQMPVAPSRLTEVSEGPMTPLWAGPELVLVRQVSVGGQEYVQGCVLDWPSLRQSMLASVKDLLPGADLLPAAGGLAQDDRRMASLPVRLAPGAVAVAEAPASPLRWSLAGAWACVVAAGLAAAWLLHGALSLSHRRGAFVSAVTHELRTPLTTFRLYAEMLSEGMVNDHARQQSYLHTLRQEAQRLDHMVENVLAYARLDGAPKRPGLTEVTVGELLDANQPRLADRAMRDGLQLVVEPDADARASRVQVHPAAVEQVLMNVVDNACKYARTTTDRRLHIGAQLREGELAITVRDHGPGVDAQRRSRLFKPFCKSSSEAANSVAGVGLGLALSRRLARAMGGDLRLDDLPDDGAQFSLLIKTVR